MSKEKEAKTLCLYYTGQRWHNGIKQPKEIKDVYVQIKEHPYYCDPSRVSSLSRWILEQVCINKLSESEEANDTWARSLWEYLLWDGENYGFNEGEGKESIFQKMFLDV
jgi:hypothetical protein